MGDIPTDLDPLNIEIAENSTEEVLLELLSDDKDDSSEDGSDYTEEDSEKDDSETEETNIIYDDPHLWELQTPCYNVTLPHTLFFS